MEVENQDAEQWGPNYAVLWNVLNAKSKQEQNSSMGKQIRDQAKPGHLIAKQKTVKHRKTHSVRWQTETTQT